MEEFPEFLEARRPGGFCCEEVKDMLLVDQETRDTHVQKFLNVCSKAGDGYVCKAMTVDANIWMDWPRPR